MADQQRWFKLWCSVLTDDEVQSLTPADRWAWVALGAHTKQNGSRGTVTISLTNAALAGAMGVTVDDLHSVLQRLPHLTLKNEKSDNGKLTVTWLNWSKYQEDSTVYERVKRLRSKKRGEEKRGEEKRITPLSPPKAAPHSDQEFFDQLRVNPAYAHIDLERELGRLDAWLLTDRGHGKTKTRRLILNWLNRVEPAVHDRPPKKPRFRHERYCECVPGSPDPRCLALSNGSAHS